MGARFVRNEAGIAAILRMRGVGDRTDHVGQLVRIRAEQIAPVDTGAYAFGVEAGNGAHDGGFRVETGVVGDRYRTRVVNGVRSGPSKRWPQGYPYGVALERGNSRVKAQRILGRALDAVNLA